MFNSGIVDGAGGSGFNTVTFINNHDFRGPGEPVQNDPMLAYAYILTNNRVGLPSAFYPDYYGVSIPNAPTVNLKAAIDQLISLHQQYIFGASSADYLSRIGTGYSASYTSGFDHTTLLYQLSGGIGGKEVIVAINFAGVPLEVDHQINMSNLSSSDTFDDLTGNATGGTATLNGSNQLHIEVPARSYAVYVQNDVALPLADLVGFQAVAQPTSVALDWTTRETYDLAGFAIERSAGGQHFQEIGWTPAVDHFETTQVYGFIDTQVQAGETYYYRLRLQDLSGAKSYTTVRQVELKGLALEAHFTPNPVQGPGLLQWKNDRPQQFVLECYHASGHRIWSRQVEGNSGWQQQFIDTGDWAPGVYYLKLYSNGGEWVRKIIKL